jgi:hypothetical protein
MKRIFLLIFLSALSLSSCATNHIEVDTEQRRQSAMDLFFRQVKVSSPSGVGFKFRESRDLEVLFLKNNTNKDIIVLTYSLYMDEWIRVADLHPNAYGSDRDSDDLYEDGIGVALVPTDAATAVRFLYQDDNDVYFEINDVKADNNPAPESKLPADNAEAEPDQAAKEPSG